MTATSATSPVLLVLDDLQWAAKPTLLLLRHVLRSTEPIHLFAVATYRDTELGLTHPLCELDQVAEWLPTPGRVNAIGQWNLAVLGAEAAGLVGDGERAHRLYPLVLQALGTGTLLRQYDGALIHRAAGMAAAAAGMDEAAQGHFEEALRQAQELPQLMERPQVRHWYGPFLLDLGGSGDRGRARALLEEAVAGYHSIGMPRHEAMARELLTQLEAPR
jgi:hypothetical protein